MKLPRRKFLHLAAGAAALPAVSRIARAQAYPSRPVRWIIGFPPGSAADLVARLLGQWLSQRLGQQFIIENRPGAGSNIAAEAVVRAPPDGYTLLLVVATNTINATLYDKLSFNFIRDIVPVASIGRTPKFIAYAKANPGKLNLASSGNGTASHVFGELFKAITGVDLVHVPYRGSFYPDLLAGQVQVTFTSIPGVMGYIRAGQLRMSVPVISLWISLGISDELGNRLGRNRWMHHQDVGHDNNAGDRRDVADEIETKHE
jgi:tripartite-type tricarboxylate transporter receptor subunit TctC